MSDEVSFFGTATFAHPFSTPQIVFIAFAAAQSPQELSDPPYFGVLALTNASTTGTAKACANDCFTGGFTLLYDILGAFHESSRGQMCLPLALGPRVPSSRHTRLCDLLAPACLARPRLARSVSQEHFRPCIAGNVLLVSHSTWTNCSVLIGIVPTATFSPNSTSVIVSSAALLPANLIFTFAGASTRAIHTSDDCAITFTVEEFSDYERRTALASLPSAPAAASIRRPNSALSGRGLAFRVYFSGAPLGCWVNVPGATFAGLSWVDVAVGVVGAADNSGNTAYIQPSRTAATRSAAFLGGLAPSSAVDPQNGLPPVNGTVSSVLLAWIYGSASPHSTWILPTFGAMFLGERFPFPAAITYNAIKPDAAIYGERGKAFQEVHGPACPFFYTATPPPDLDACERQARFESAPAPPTLLSHRRTSVPLLARL